jgi:pimeloyl-ACP methyl ester carboxylesterase
MRRTMVEARHTLDPQMRSPALDQTVLVGHSMGGLVSRLQSVDAEDHFWSTISDHPIANLKGDEQLKRDIAGVFFFQPNPSVRRVVTIGTPHRGSEFANHTTRWLGASLIKLPNRFNSNRQQLLVNNRDLLRPDAPVNIRTSIDSLAPDSVLLDRLLTAEAAPWVGYHNIVGRQPDAGFAGYFAGEGDGVVSLASARLDELPQLKSQIIVPADHMSVHRHPQAVIEVRRILIDQVEELRRGDIAFEANHRTAAQPTGTSQLR